MFELASFRAQLIESSDELRTKRKTVMIRKQQHLQLYLVPRAYPTRGGLVRKSADDRGVD